MRRHVLGEMIVAASGYLPKMEEIVSHPACQQLSGSDLPNRRVPRRPVQIRFLDLPKPGEASLPL